MISVNGISWRSQDSHESFDPVLTVDCLDGGTVAGAGSHLMSTLLCYYVDIVICLPWLAGNNHIV